MMNRLSTLIILLLLGNKCISQEYTEKEYLSIIEYTTAKIKEDSIRYKDYFRERGKVFFYLNKLNEAIKDYDKYLYYQRNDYSAYYERGLIKAYLKDYKGSIKDFKLAIKEKSVASNAYFSMGLSYENLSIVDKAIESYNNSLNYNEKNEDALNNLGLIYCNLREYDKSIKFFNKALAINENKVNSLYTRGYVNTILGNYSLAEQDLLNALKLQPENGYIFNYLSFFYYKKNDIEKACTYLKKAKEKKVKTLIEMKECSR